MERSGKAGNQMLKFANIWKLQIGKYRPMEYTTKGKYICAFIL